LPRCTNSVTDTVAVGLSVDDVKTLVPMLVMGTKENRQRQRERCTNSVPDTAVVGLNVDDVKSLVPMLLQSSLTVNTLSLPCCDSDKTTMLEVSLCLLFVIGCILYMYTRPILRPGGVSWKQGMDAPPNDDEDEGHGDVEHLIFTALNVWHLCMFMYVCMRGGEGEREEKKGRGG